MNIQENKALLSTRTRSRRVYILFMARNINLSSFTAIVHICLCLYLSIHTTSVYAIRENLKLDDNETLIVSKF